MAGTDHFGDTDRYAGFVSGRKPLTISPPADSMLLERIVCEKRLHKLWNGGNGHGGNGNGAEKDAQEPVVTSTPKEPTASAALQAAVTEPPSTPTTVPQTQTAVSSAPLSAADLDFFAQNPTPPPYISDSFIIKDDAAAPPGIALPSSPAEEPQAPSPKTQPPAIDAAPSSLSSAPPVLSPAPSTDSSTPSTDNSTPSADSGTPSADSGTPSADSGSSVPGTAAPAAAPVEDHAFAPSTGYGADHSLLSSALRLFGQLMTFAENGVEIAGHRRSFMGFIIAFVVVVFVGNLLLSSVSGLFSSSGALHFLGQQSPEISLSGQWVTNYVYRGRPFQGRMIVQQSGSQLSGYGRDPLYFEFSGTQNSNQIHIVKVYYDPQTKSKIGFPVTLDGVITKWDQNRLNMHGIYVTSIKQGIFLHAHIATVEGSWQADLTSTALPKLETAPSFQPSSSFIPSMNKTQEFQSFLMKIAGGFLLVGILMVLGSLKMFGPNGLVNIWSKKEYIPSQFKSYHNKMIWELGKPIRPGSVPLGERIDWNLLQFYKPKKLAIPQELRNTNPHILILGGGDKGKSRLMANMIFHDIQDSGRAVVVIDSDGGLVDLTLRHIASHPDRQRFANQLILVDPTHTGGGCPAYNPLEMPEDGDLQAAASAIVFGFKAIYTEPPGSQSQWNQQTANILRNASLLLMVNGKTLTDLPVLLSDNDFRDVLLDNVEKRKDEHVEYISLLETWSQYKRLARTDQWINWVEPILNRVSPMLSDSRIRTILTKPKGDLNLREVISQGKTLLVKVPHGHLDQNADLLGSLIVTGLKQAALSLSNGGSQKHPCALYLDEFDNFIEKETFDALTHETHKFQVGLTCAVKTLQNLPEDFRNQISINVGTICAFALGKKDADMLGPQMFRVDGRKIKHQTMQNIFNRVNSSFHFELISDEEKLNIDRVIGLEERTYFCYRVGTIAGVFNLRAFEFPDVPDERVDHALIKRLYAADNVHSPKAAG